MHSKNLTQPTRGICLPSARLQKEKLAALAIYNLTVNGLWFHPPEISGTTKGMTMKFLPDVGVYKEARNQKNFLT